MDRGLVDEQDILVHGSGTYATDAYRPIPPDALWHVENTNELHDIMRKACAPGPLS